MVFFLFFDDSTFAETVLSFILWNNTIQMQQMIVQNGTFFKKKVSNVMTFKKNNLNLQMINTLHY